VARLSAPTRSYSIASTPIAAVAATSDERRAFDLVNVERQRSGLRPLVWDGALTRIARYHSENMARDGVLNHVDSDGLDLRGRAEVLGLRGWKALGENIAYSQGYSDLPAFAKINLGLRVHGRRADGYHEISTLFQTITLHDKLTFESRRDEHLELDCSDPDIPTDESNLVLRAALSLRERFGVARGARI